MTNMNDIIKVAVDAYHGNVQKYSKGESMEMLRNAMIEANGGSTTLNYKNIRDGKCTGLFALVEEILMRTVVEGLSESDFFYNLVDFRNVAEGDRPVFVVNDANLSAVATVTDWSNKYNAYAVDAKNNVTKLAVVVDDGVATIKVPAYSVAIVYEGTLKNVKAAAAAEEVTNPGTGANDVVGIAAALAVVALVSGAAISLKK